MERKLYMKLKHYQSQLTKQQYLTIKGQIKKGDYMGADKGLNRLMKSKIKKHQLSFEN